MLLLIFTVSILIVNFDKLGEKSNLTLDDIEVSNVLFSNINYVKDKGNDNYIIKMNVTNNNDKMVNLGDFYINIYNRKGEKIYTFDTGFIKDIKSGNKITLTSVTEENIGKISSISIELPNLKYIEE